MKKKETTDKKPTPAKEKKAGKYDITVKVDGTFEDAVKMMLNEPKQMFPTAKNNQKRKAG